MKNKHLINIITAALFAAFIFAATAYLPRIPLPGGLGYVHIGDAFILLCASLLQKRYSVCAGAIGGMLADIVTGYAIYAPFTAVAKAGIALCISSRGDKCLSKHNMLFSLITVPVTVIVYFAADAIIAGSLTAPLASAPFNALQAVISIALFFLCAKLIDAASIKNKITKQP
ncbi:MAG TPA: TIGR04002 family protein [Bacillota bacterium]|nr:TIGR04002 family protein [Bacillota bacterium]